MKRILIAAAAIALVVSAVSCKKCVNCKYEYVYLGDTVTVNYPEECGTAGEISDFKDAKQSEAMLKGVDLVCEDVK